jgi:hypothetical protein
MSIHVAVALGFIVFFTQPAFAYVDQGSGAMLVQMFLAGAVGFGVYLKLFWRRFAGMFSRRKSVRNHES